MGLRLFRTMAEAHERWVNEILGAFSDEESETMIGLLDALRLEVRTGGRNP
jgi:DNA-binding MarR family transcriptional regulator